MPTNATPNPHEFLNTIVRSSSVGWVKQNTAILVVHGIGEQLPLETLDHFGRGLIKQYRKAFGDKITISHEIVSKPDDGGSVWFDNVLRIHKAGNDNYIDLYEYYWSNYTKDKASWKDLNAYLQGVVKGANSFYKRNAALGKTYKDKSAFFETKTGNFKVGTYKLFMITVSKAFLLLDLLYRVIIWLISLIPFLGTVADNMFQSYVDGVVHTLTDLLGDVVVYNVTDPKSKFYDVRRKVLDGAVKAVTYLIQKPLRKDLDVDKLNEQNETDKLGKSEKATTELYKKLAHELDHEELYYPSVIIAGHSLGSQVSYDAINKINLLINEGKINTYDGDGVCRLKNKTDIVQQLRGFITFGCPLDKILFFLRENVPDEQYLRQQLLDNYHEFKQRNLDFLNKKNTNKDFMPASCKLKRVLDDIKWRNYYDAKDYVSGGLDYYSGLTNIDCQFKAGKFGFTHGNYWDYDKFYVDIISNYLSD